MNRCASLCYAAALATLLAAPAASSAQMARPFPPDTLRGELRVDSPPEVRLNGKPARLAPGARIRNTMNMFQVSGSLVGQPPLLVHYTLDPIGQIRDVWLLNDTERSREPWPRTEKELRSWTFDAQTGAWIKP